MGARADERARRRWFLRPLWRDPAFLFCFVLSALLYAAMAPFLWPRATNTLYAVLLVAYFFVLWLIVSAVVSLPIRTIRNYWRGREESDERDRTPGAQRTKTQAAARVAGRMVGRRRGGGSGGGGSESSDSNMQ